MQTIPTECYYTKVMPNRSGRNVQIAKGVYTIDHNQHDRPSALANKLVKLNKSTYQDIHVIDLKVQQR